MNIPIFGLNTTEVKEVESEIVSLKLQIKAYRNIKGRCYFNSNRQHELKTLEKELRNSNDRLLFLTRNVNNTLSLIPKEYMNTK